jgi:hypothetical protein
LANLFQVARDAKVQIHRLSRQKDNLNQIREMKQTTIQIYIEEAICGATVFATSKRTKFHPYNGSRALPLPEEEAAWKLIAGENAQWGIGKVIEPKEGEFDNLTWFKNLSERIDRVCGNRKFKSKVSVLESVSQGYAIKWSVTIYWDKPIPKFSQDTKGTWTLREFNGCSKRGRILDKFDGTLECLGDDLYWRLPDGEVPEGYDAFPDYNSVIVCQTLEEENENPIWWGFEFKPSRKSNK